MIDGARADEQLGRRLPVGQALADGPGHLQFLGHELVDGRGAQAGPGDGLAGGPEFVPGVLGPAGTEPVEGIGRQVQVSLGGDPAAVPT